MNDDMTMVILVVTSVYGLESRDSRANANIDPETRKTQP